MLYQSHNEYYYRNVSLLGVDGSFDAVSLAEVTGGVTVAVNKLQPGSASTAAGAGHVTVSVDPEVSGS